MGGISGNLLDQDGSCSQSSSYLRRNRAHSPLSIDIHDHDHAYCCHSVVVQHVSTAKLRQSQAQLMIVTNYYSSDLKLPSSSSTIPIPILSETAALFSLRSFYTRFRKTIIPEIKPYFDLKGRMSVPPYAAPPGERAPAYRRSELKVACVQFDVKVCLFLRSRADGSLVK